VAIVLVFGLYSIPLALRTQPFLVSRDRSLTRANSSSSLCFSRACSALFLCLILTFRGTPESPVSPGLPEQLHSAKPYHLSSEFQYLVQSPREFQVVIRERIARLVSVFSLFPTRPTRNCNRQIRSTLRLPYPCIILPLPILPRSQLHFDARPSA
jgi:hypothetical protein